MPRRSAAAPQSCKPAIESESYVSKLKTVAWVALLSVMLSQLGACTHTPPNGAITAAPPQSRPIATVATEADAAYNAQQWLDSEHLYTELVTREPARVEAWFKLGNVYARTERPDFAVRAYREVLSREPHHVRALHNLGMVQLREAATSFAALSQFGTADDPLVRHASTLTPTLQALLPAKATSNTP